MKMRDFTGIDNPKSLGCALACLQRRIELASIFRALAENTCRAEFSNTLIVDHASDAGREARPATPEAGVIPATLEFGLNRLGFKLAIQHHKNQTR